MNKERKQYTDCNAKAKYAAMAVNTATAVYTEKAQYAKVSGISLILSIAAAFFWEQAGYALPSVQGAAALAFGVLYIFCGFQASLLVPQEEPQKENEVRDTQGEIRQRAA